MNGTYYQNPTFPVADDENFKDIPETTNYTENIEVTDDIPKPGIDYVPMEQSYIENILRLNRGARAKAYVTFPDSGTWRDRIFDGTIEQAGRDHLVMSAQDGRWFLVPMIYLDYVEFEGKIIYRPIELEQKKD